MYEDLHSSTNKKLNVISSDDQAMVASAQKDMNGTSDQVEYAFIPNHSIDTSTKDAFSHFPGGVTQGYSHHLVGNNSFGTSVPGGVTEGDSAGLAQQQKQDNLYGVGTPVGQVQLPQQQTPMMMQGVGINMGAPITTQQMAQMNPAGATISPEVYAAMQQQFQQLQMQQQMQVQPETCQQPQENQQQWNSGGGVPQAYPAFPQIVAKANVQQQALNQIQLQMLQQQLQIQQQQLNNQLAMPQDVTIDVSNVQNAINRDGSDSSEGQESSIDADQMSVQIIENYEVMMQNMDNQQKSSKTQYDKRRICIFISKMLALYVVLLLITHLILYFAVPCSNNAKRRLINLACEICDQEDHDFVNGVCQVTEKICTDETQDKCVCPQWQEKQNGKCVNKCQNQQVFDLELQECKSCQYFENMKNNECVLKCSENLGFIYDQDTDSCNACPNFWQVNGQVIMKDENICSNICKDSSEIFDTRATNKTTMCLSIRDHVDQLTQSNRLLQVFNQTGVLSGSMFKPLFLRDPTETNTYNPLKADRVHTVYSDGSFHLKNNIQEVHFRTKICTSCGAKDIFMIVHLFLKDSDYQQIKPIIQQEHVNDLNQNMCDQNPRACWMHPESFKNNIDFFAMISLYSQSNNIYMVEEGYYSQGKRNGFFRLSSLNQNFVGWYRNDIKHGKHIEYDVRTNTTRRVIYDQGVQKDTFEGFDLIERF